MKTKNTRFFLSAAIASMVAFTTSSHAQLVGSWDINTYVVDGSLDGTSVVLNTGTPVVGWNAGGGSDVTINGVLFQQNPDDNTGVDLVSTSNSTVTGANSDDFTGNFQTLMSNIAFNGNAGTPNFRSFTVTLEGLTIGQRYSTQFLSYQSGSTRNFTIYYGDDTSGSSTPVSVSSSGPGQSRIATFDAEATTQAFLFYSTGTSVVPIVNAVAVTAIPEPSTVALLFSVGVGALLLSRRRARR